MSDLAVSRTVSQSERMVGGFRSYGFESVSSVGSIMDRTFQCFCYFNREEVVVFGFSCRVISESGCLWDDPDLTFNHLHLLRQ